LGNVAHKNGGMIFPSFVDQVNRQHRQIGMFVTR